MTSFLKYYNLKYFTKNPKKIKYRVFITQSYVQGVRQTIKMLQQKRMEKEWTAFKSALSSSSSPKVFIYIHFFYLLISFLSFDLYQISLFNLCLLLCLKQLHELSTLNSSFVNSYPIKMVIRDGPSGLAKKKNTGQNGKLDLMARIGLSCTCP